MYLCNVRTVCTRRVPNLWRLPICTGMARRLLQERLSSVRVRISHTHSGNTPRRLWDKFRLFSWENLTKEKTECEVYGLTLFTIYIICICKKNSISGMNTTKTIKLCLNSSLSCITDILLSKKFKLVDIKKNTDGLYVSNKTAIKSCKLKYER